MGSPNIDVNQLRNILSGSDSILSSQNKEALSDAMEVSQEHQVASKEGLQDAAESLTPPKTKEKHKDIKSFSKRAAKLQKGEKVFKSLEALKEDKKDQQGSADDFQRQNPDLKSNKLLKILDKVGELKKQNHANPKDILDAIRSEFKEPYLIDRAMEFLLENSQDDAELHQVLGDTQKEHYEVNKGQIDAGKNINEVTSKYSTKIAKEPSELRDLYRDITGNPRDTKDLFNELSKKYPTLKELQQVLKFLYNALGKDLNSAGPSIEPGKLLNLINESKTLQAISGVYKYFQGRSQLVIKLFAETGVQTPQGFTFQTLAKQFITFLGDRYPTSDKVLSMAEKMGFHTTAGKILITEAERDSVRQISSRVYNSVQHRDEVLGAILEALEKLYQDEEMEFDQATVAESRSHLQEPLEMPMDPKNDVVEDFYGNEKAIKNEKAA